MNSSDKNQITVESFVEEAKNTFFFQIHRIQKAISRNGTQTLQEANIPLQLDQVVILITVFVRDGLSQQEIADIIYRDKSSIQRSLTSFQKKGLVKIVQDKNDKRRNIVKITNEGKVLAARVKELMKEVEKETLAALSQTDREVAIQNIKEIADKLEKK